MTMHLIVTLILQILIVGAFIGIFLHSPVNARDVAWLAGGATPADPDAAEVYRRYLARHRAHRFFGGVIGVLISIVYNFSSQILDPTAAGGSSPLGDLLLCLIGGVLIGALSAETYRLSIKDSERTVATLAARTPLARPDLAKSARAAAAFSLLIGLVVLLTGRSWQSLTLALFAVVIIAVGERTRRAINDRRRPVLSDAAAEVDQRIRGFASESVARLEHAAGLFAIAGALGAGIQSPPGTISDTYAMVLVLKVSIGVLAFIVAVAQLRGSSTKPPRSFVAESPVGAAP